MSIQKNKKIILPVLLMATFPVLFYNCNPGNSDSNNVTTDAIFKFVASDTIPEDVPINASDTALAEYAWKEFLALNWKASYGKSRMKGMPDTSWSYADESPNPDTVVWETFAHRTELSPFTSMRPFDSACNYSYYYPPAPASDSASFGLLNNLDETSEIGSCNLFAFIDSTHLYPDDQVVRYQAKTNRVEYDYIKDSFAVQGSLDSAVKRTKAYFNSKFKNPGMDTVRPGGLVQLPNGSIEVKTAWRRLKAGEDPSKFFTRKVIVYSATPISGNTFSYSNRTYALIGMHIIHKSKNHPSFVFATWEHIGVVSQDSMKYVLLDSSDQSETLGFRSPIRNEITGIFDLATEFVHQNILQGNSVWKNYRLVGVQGTPTNDSTKANFFLANYVIESDSLLARFHGSGFDSPFNHRANVVYLNDTFSVGGCQGCHGGGAQHKGSDFSFIVNSKDTTPDAVAGPPNTNAAVLPGAEFWKGKLARLKKAYR